MKLITRTNRNFLAIILFLLPLSCIALFLMLNYFLSDEVDEKLRVDELRILQHIENNPEFISMAPVIEVEQIDGQIQAIEGVRNVSVFDPIENEDEPFRELVSVHIINGKQYLIKVRHSIIEDKVFLLTIGLTMTAILLLIFVSLLFLNQRFSLKLWKPFYANLEQLKSFSFVENEPFILTDSKIDEFQDLKSSLIMLTDKLQTDYQSLKEFTENASHEIQTPLSIIAMNLDELLQEEWDEANYKKLYASYQVVQRLSKLNEKLLLLAKIDNEQFQDNVEVNFNLLLLDKIDELKSLGESNNLTFDCVTSAKGELLRSYV